jgi:hypothetical protein
MLDPLHCLQPLLWRLCSQMLAPPALLALASLAVVLADACLAALLALTQAHDSAMLARA